MDYKDLTSILLKTTGATLIFWYVSWFPSALSTGFEQPFDGTKLFIELLPPIFGLGMALFIFNFPATIANKLINGEKLSHDGKSGERFTGGSNTFNWYLSPAHRNN